MLTPSSSLRRSRAHQRAFTLIELSIVVVIVGIIAVIGGVIYSRHRATVRTLEAKEMTNNIRMAQEAYFRERGLYANISADTSSFYPAAAPAKFVTAWGKACTNCTAGADWNTLPVHPSAPVMYGYATIAGFGATPPSQPLGFTEPMNSLVNENGPLAATDPFYVTVAWGDTDGNGIPVIIMSYSTSNILITQNEGE